MKDHADILKQGTQKWNAWRERNRDVIQPDLREVALCEADLEGANLEGANLRETKLHEANFHEAHLQDANLEGATGLQVKQLRGANLSNAILPASTPILERLGGVRDATQNARKLFLALLAACVFCWLTIAMTTDAGLVTNTATSALPTIGTAVPIEATVLIVKRKRGADPAATACRF